MQEAGLPLLSNWQNFYMIIGTAAATLTGLMFVATTLIAGIEVQNSTLNAGLSAFTTPTFVHFCVVLLIAGILSVPWQAFASVSLLLGLVGLGGVLYLNVVIQRMRHVPGYQTPLKDWLWYTAFPLIAYIVLIVAAILLPANPALALYIISSVMAALLFLGLHNAWDLVTYLAIERAHPEDKSRD
jgi:CBS domain containing-hemolysin-like protein